MVLDQRLQSRPEHEWTVSWQRADGNGKVTPMTGRLRQQAQQRHDEFGHTVTYLAFGAGSEFERGRGLHEPITSRVQYAAVKAVERTGESIGAMVSGFVAILGGRVPGDSVGGPLMMYRVASVSGHKGWDSFLLMLALISVNLGLINLLPVPVLDGARIQYAGQIVVGIITILALRNDVVRYLLQ
jgi:regulator of sigma E protease